MPKDPWTDPNPQPGDFDSELDRARCDQIELHKANPEAKRPKIGIIDGARLSRAKIKVFRHKDVAHAEELLKEIENEPGRKLIITDGVFSMDGDIGPVDKLCDLADKYGAIMMVDDAHASGVRHGLRYSGQSLSRHYRR